MKARRLRVLRPLIGLRRLNIRSIRPVVLNRSDSSVSLSHNTHATTFPFAQNPQIQTKPTSVRHQIWQTLKKMWGFSTTPDGVSLQSHESIQLYKVFDNVKARQRKKNKESSFRQIKVEGWCRWRWRVLVKPRMTFSKTRERMVAHIETGGQAWTPHCEQPQKLS